MFQFFCRITTEEPKKLTTELPKKKRRKKFSKRYGISYGSPLRIRPFRPRFKQGLIVSPYGKNLHRGQVFWKNKNRRLSPEKVQKALKSHRYANSLKSSFDFNGLVALAGLWVVWNTFLVSIVPNSFLLDIVNNVGRKRSGRSFQLGPDRLQDIIDKIEHKNK